MLQALQAQAPHLLQDEHHRAWLEARGQQHADSDVAVFLEGCCRRVDCGHAEEGARAGPEKTAREVACTSVRGGGASLREVYLRGKELTRGTEGKG